MLRGRKNAREMPLHWVNVQHEENSFENSRKLWKYCKIDDKKLWQRGGDVGGETRCESFIQSLAYIHGNFVMLNKQAQHEWVVHQRQKQLEVESLCISRIRQIAKIHARNGKKNWKQTDRRRCDIHFMIFAHTRVFVFRNVKCTRWNWKELLGNLSDCGLGAS